MKLKANLSKILGYMEQNQDSFAKDYQHSVLKNASSQGCSVLFYGMNLYHMFNESSKKAYAVMIKQFGHFDWVPIGQETLPAMVGEDTSLQFLFEP
jgi:hypothetical protein